MYPSAVPLDTDLLTPQRNTMVAFGALIAATLGSATVVDGLAVTAGAGLTVQVGPGSIYSNAPLDALAYGSLPADTADSIVKCGINTQPITSTTLTAPPTLGQSINYLLQAQFQEADGVPVVLSFYNAANPPQPFSGPNNTGTASNTVRSQRASLVVKPGTAATSGTQVTPGADAGWTPLAIVTVPYGTTSLTGANIVTHPSAPFVMTKLPQVRRRLTANLALFVAPAGNDANSGLASWNAFATMQAAWNYVISSLDLASAYSVAVNVAAGTYTTPLLCGGNVVGLGGVNGVSFVGAGAGSTFLSVVNAHAFYAVGGANVSVSNMTLAASGTNGSVPATAIAAINGASVSASNVAFGASGIHIWATQTATISLFASYAINAGAATSHVQASANSAVLYSNVAVTVVGTPAFGTFAVATGSLIQFSGTTIAGSATGQRYSVYLNGTINTNGGGATYLPGSVAGATSTGGQYA